MHRSFASLVTLLMVIAMGGCTTLQPTVPAAPAPASQGPAAAQPGADFCGDKSRLDDTLNFYNWSDYITTEILDKFQQACGVKVVLDTYSSNEDLLAKLQAGATGYDVIVPSDYMVRIMRQLDLLRPLDHANLPNLANIDSRFTTAPYDEGNQYSVPYQWGTTGIGYDLAALGAAPTSWAALFAPDQAATHQGKISLLNDMREVFGAALKYLGYSVNSSDPAQLAEAKALLSAIKPYVATFDSDSFSDLLVSGETVLAQGWSGGIFQAMANNPDRQLGYVIPSEGGVIWTDNLAIPKTAPHPYTGEVFINFLLDPQIGAEITNYTYYASPNNASLPHILDEIKSSPGIYPPAETMAKLEFIRDLGEATPAWERLWTELKAGQ